MPNTAGNINSNNANSTLAPAPADDRPHTGSLLQNFLWEMDPHHYTAFDYLGLASGVYFAGVAKLATAGDAAAQPALWAALKSQFTDDVAKYFGLPWTGLWAGGSALNAASKASAGDGLSTGLKDLASSGVGLVAAVGVGVVGVMLAGDVLVVGATATAVGFLAQKLTSAKFDTWDDDHAGVGSNTTTETRENGTVWTHTHYANGDFVDSSSAGDYDYDYYNASTMIKTNIDPDGSSTVSQCDSLNNIVATASYDSNGILLKSTSADGSSVTFDGNSATVHSADGTASTFSLQTDADGKSTFSFDDGRKIVVDPTAGSATFVDPTNATQMVTSHLSDGSSTYQTTAADGSRAIQTVSADGHTTVTESFDSSGTLLSKTTKTVDSGTGDSTYENDNYSDGGHATTTISADGNYTHVIVTHSDGSTSDTVIEPGDNGGIQSTVGKLLSDGTISTEIIQMNTAGQTTSSWLKSVSMDGTVLVDSKTFDDQGGLIHESSTTTTADGTVTTFEKDGTTVHKTITDSIGNSESVVLNSDGSKHLEWATSDGSHGAKDVDVAGNQTEQITLHERGVDVLGNSLMQTIPGGGAIPTAIDISFSDYHNVDGTSGFVFNESITGAMLETSKDPEPDGYVPGIADAGPNDPTGYFVSNRSWISYPTAESPGQYELTWSLRQQPSWSYVQKFNYAYDPNYKVEYGIVSNTDTNGQVSTVTGNDPAANEQSFVDGYNATYVPGFAPYSSGYDLKLIEELQQRFASITMPANAAASLSLPPSYAPPVSVSETLPDGQTAAQLTGSDDLTVSGNGLNNTIVANSGNDTLIGGSGNAVLVGGSGHDTLVAGSGNSDLVGGSGDTTFVSGSGNSTITGGTGHNDIHAFGTGNVTIKNSKPTDTLHFGQGVSSGSVAATAVVAADGTVNYVLTDSSARTITIQGGTQSLDQIVFGDGTTSSLAQLMYATDPVAVSATSGASTTLASGIVHMTVTGTDPVTIRANSIDDTIIANDAGDTLIAGVGSNTLVAGRGNDVLVGNRGYLNAGTTTFVYGLGDGHTTIKSSNDMDIVKFGDGISLSDLQKIVSSDSNGHRVISLISDTGVSVDLQGDQYGSGMPGTIAFADGSATNVSDLGTAVNSSLPIAVTESDSGALNVEVLSTQGGTVHLGSTDARVTGTSGNEIFYAGSGHAVIYGGGGGDSFVAGQGDAEFVGGSGGAMYIVAPDSGNIVISKSTASDQLVFNGNVSKSGFTAAAFHQPDGTVNYVISSPSGKTVTIIPDDGHVVNSLAFGTSDYGTLSDLLLSTDPTATMSTDMASIVPVGVVKLTLTGSADLTVTGNELDDTITANSGNDTLIAGTGHDTLVAGTGSDTFVGNGTWTSYHFDLGDGFVKVLNSSSNDQIYFGSGISSGELRTVETTTSDGQRVIYLETSAGPIMALYGNENGQIVNQVVFSDGTTERISDIPSIATADGALVVSGSDATSYQVKAVSNTGTTVHAGDFDVTLRASDGNDTLVAGAGNDTLVAGTGNDKLVGAATMAAHGHTTYVIDDHSGETTILDSTSADTLLLGQGIGSTVIEKVVSIDTDGNTIQTLQFASGTHVNVVGDKDTSVSTLSFDDGSHVQLSDIQPSVEASGPVTVSTSPDGTLAVNVIGQNPETVQVHSGDAIVTGGTGGDTLIAGGSHTTLIGNGGVDTFVSGTGDAEFRGDTDSTYLIVQGSGNVEIIGGGNLVVFGSGISSNMLSASAVQELDGSVKYTIAVEGQGSVTLDTLGDGKTLLPSISLSGSGEGYTISDLLSATDPNANISTDSSLDMPVDAVNVHLLGTAPLTVRGNELNDTIFSNDGNDILIAGTGITTLIAGHGNDTLMGNSGNGQSTFYQYDLGDGTATISHSTSNDAIELGANITQSSINIQSYVNNAGEQVVELQLNTGGVIDIIKGPSGDMVDEVDFADGTWMSISNMLSSMQAPAHTGAELIGQPTIVQHG